MMKISKNLIAAVFSLAVLFLSTANAQYLPQILPGLNKFNRPVSNPKNEDQTSVVDLQTGFDNLTAKARENGTVKIIVGFKVENFKLDAELNNFQQAEQRGLIKEIQASLLNRVNNFSVINPKLFDYIPFMAMEVSADALAELRKSSAITSIQEDIEQKPQLLQSVPLIGGPGAWAAGFTGQGRTIAVLDTGVDKTHPFFNNRVVSEACYSTNNGTTTSFCPGGASSSTASGSGLHCTIPFSGTSGINPCHHGTHVAGIAAGGNPLINGAGVAKNANIIAIQVFSRSTSCGSEPSPCLTSVVSDTIAGLERVYALRTTYTIDAVNLSLGSGQYTSYCDTQFPQYKSIIDTLRAANIATVVSSGNNGYTNALISPACISTAISVGSTHDGSVGIPDIVSDFSNSAIFLNLLAPGELISSAIPGNSYGETQGTSQAAPHVAGAIAVIRHKFPTDTVTDVLTRLKYGGVVINDPENGIGKPRINVNTSLTTSNVDPCTSITPISIGQTINGSLLNSDCLLTFGARADIYSFTANQGQTVAISQNSTAFDAYLLLFNSSNTLLAQDDNGGGGTNARIPATSGFFTIPATGTYYIDATRLLFGNPGNYTLTLTGGTSCNFTISSSSQNFTASGGNGSFNVTTAAGCAWTAQSNNSAWLTTTSTGNGSGTVNYSVTANASATPRTATITAGGQIHTVTQAGTAAPTVRRPFDFDGDGKTDISIFRPSAGEWWYSKSSNGGNAALKFGASTDKLTPADFTGDGKTDIAFWRPSTGFWFILRSEDGNFLSFPFGTNGDVPFVGDFDGDGKADPGIFRPSGATWYISKSSGGTIITTFGTSSDKPVPADYDGDGKTDIAIYRPSVGEWWINRSSNNSVLAFQFGNSADKPVQGDYTGDGRADAAFWRPSTGFWFILRSEDNSFYSVPFGTTGDAPTPGDYDGDGKFDTAVFRPANATWFINRTTAGILIATFGSTGDLAVPNAFVP